MDERGISRQLRRECLRGNNHGREGGDGHSSGNDAGRNGAHGGTFLNLDEGLLTVCDKHNEFGPVATLPPMRFNFYSEETTQLRHHPLAANQKHLVNIAYIQYVKTFHTEKGRSSTRRFPRMVRSFTFS